MKKIVRLIIMIMILMGTLFVTTGCKEKDTNKGDNIAIEENVNVKASNTETKINNVQNTTLEHKPEVLQVTGVQMTIPDGYVSEKIYGNTIYTKATKNGKVHLCYVSLIDPELKIDNLTTFLNELFYYEINELYSNKLWEKEFNMTQDSKEECRVYNNKATKISGKIHLSENTPDLSYTAYYALANLKKYGETDIPMLWIAFGDDTEENAKEIESGIKLFIDSIKEY